MVSDGRRRNILLFISFYPLLAVPPYLALNWGVVVDVLDRSFPPGLVATAVLGAGGVVILAALLRASEGVDRYTQFLLAPTDWLSILVGLSFVLAGASWWAVPELVVEWFGRIGLAMLYFLVFMLHVTMLLFLSGSHSRKQKTARTVS